MNKNSTTTFHPSRGQGCTTGDRHMPGAKADKVRPEPPRLIPRRQGGRASFMGDTDGHMFLLIGLLLAMGTVTLGGVVMTMSASEEMAQREQRENLMGPVKTLMAGFNESVRRSVAVGDTNITTFQDNVQEIEKRTHAQGAKDGIYLSVKLIESPDPSIWQRSGRCLSYDVAHSRGGVVVGHDAVSRLESIVGALFDVRATDGHQVVQFPYYVKIHECLPTSMTTWFSDIRVLDGYVLNPLNAKSADDNNAVMTLGELPQGSLVFWENITYADGSLAQNGWQNERYFEYNDTESAHHPATPLSDYLLFKVDVTNTPDEAVLENLRVRSDVWHIDVYDDYLQLRILYQDVALYTHHLPTNTTEQELLYPLPMSPSGNPYWTKDEVKDLVVEFQVIEVDKFDPPAFFYVEYVDVRYSYTAPERYSVVATVDWPVIPDMYDRNSIELRYEYTNSTPDEEFHVQIYSNGTWQTRLVLAPTNGSWGEARYELRPEEIESGIVEMRIIDTKVDDRWSQDGDQIHFDYIRLWSELDP